MNPFAYIAYVLDLFVAQLVFLYGFPKRKFCPLRLSGVLLLLIGVNIFNRTVLEPAFPDNPFMNFASVLFMIAVSFLGMWGTFCAKPLSVLSACMAGVALQHISHHLNRIVELIPVQMTPGMMTARSLILSATLYLLAWLFLGRWITRQRFYEDNDRRTIGAAILIVLICVGITRFLRLGGEMNPYLTICTALYAILCCVLALFVTFFVHVSVRARSGLLCLERISDE